MNSESLQQTVIRLYTQENLNCAETLLKACSEYYHLDLSEDALAVIAGFGGGMQTGNVCGALSGCTAALSRITVEGKAHESPQLKPSQVLLVRNFRQQLGDTQCSKIRIQHFDPQSRCLKTCLLAAAAMEETMKTLHEEN